MQNKTILTRLFKGQEISEELIDIYEHLRIAAQNVKNDNLETTNFSFSIIQKCIQLTKVEDVKNVINLLFDIYKHDYIDIFIAIDQVYRPENEYIQTMTTSFIIGSTISILEKTLDVVQNDSYFSKLPQRTTEFLLLLTQTSRDFRAFNTIGLKLSNSEASKISQLIKEIGKKGTLSYKSILSEYKKYIEKNGLGLASSNALGLNILEQMTYFLFKKLPIQNKVDAVLF